MKKKLVLTICTIALMLYGCNSPFNFDTTIPKHIDNFTQEFLYDLHVGNIDSCLSMLQQDLINSEAEEYLLQAHSNFALYSLDSSKLIGQNSINMLGDEGFTNYMLKYEYWSDTSFLYLDIGILEKNDTICITGFNGNILTKSISETNEFTLRKKSLVHYIFFTMAILIPCFMIITVVFIAKSRLSKKWLWIVGTLFGFIKFSLNWTTGQVGIKLISFSLLGSGFVSAGSHSPWFLSFSIPLLAIIFWAKKSKRNNKDHTNNNDDKE